MPKLTTNAIEKAKPGEKLFTIWDGGMPGFGVRIFPTGKKSFVVKTRAQGKQTLVTLGAVGVVRLEEARERAREIIQGLKLKKPLTAVLGIHGPTPTVADLARQHQAISKLKPSSQATYRIYWEAHIVPHIGKKQVGELTRLDVEKMHSKIESIWSANRCLKVLSKAFADMAGWGHPWPKVENPARGIKLHREHKTERILSYEQSKALYDELVRRISENEFDFTAWLLLVLQMTGLRTGEWRLTPRAWVNLEEGTLSLPDTKSRQQRIVMLDPRVVELLRMIPVVEGSPWFFPSPEDPRKPIGKPRGAKWHNIKKVCGIPADFRVHDIRHTFASRALVDGKLSIKEVGDLMGHKQVTTTTRYLHLLTDQQRSATSTAATAALTFEKK